MRTVMKFVRSEPVLVIAAIAAVISCLFVPPDGAYLSYIDFRTLALLYGLMVVVSGLRRAGVFSAMAGGLCARARSIRAIGVTLVCLCFFGSMLITNDVALLTFVPFTVVVLGMAGRRQDMIRIIVLETVAANLGSMLTPVGNPQNLYLYSAYDLSILDFLTVTFPVWLLSLGLLMALCLLLPRAGMKRMEGETPPVNGRSLALYLPLLALCLLTVVRLLPWPVMLALVAAALFLLDRRGLLEADFMLLLTFVAFFIFAGNLARIDGVNRLLKGLLEGHTYETSLLASQVISNVPAALLLSGFTGEVKALLLGVNIGGLGTPIASLASLISLKLYTRTEEARPGRFLAEFTVVNVALLILLSVFRGLL